MPNNRADIYALAAELQINSDEILRLIEAAELLGFANIAYGDITLNPLGETFAEASIRARKEIFATRIRRLPLFKWLLSMLHATDKKQLEWDVIQKALELEFHEEEAERQLDTAIDWGRYAEILAYDDSSQVLFLEPGGAIGIAKEPAAPAGPS
jgi:NitT/TauT family transport system ATP-binding protein